MLLKACCGILLVVLIVTGTTKIKNLNTNIGSLAVTLTQEDVKEITNAIPADEVNGDREIPLLSDYCYKLANTPRSNL